MRGEVTGHRVGPLSANIRMDVIRIQLPVHSPHTWNLPLSYAMAQSGVTRAHGQTETSRGKETLKKRWPFAAMKPEQVRSL